MDLRLPLILMIKLKSMLSTQKLKMYSLKPRKPTLMPLLLKLLLAQMMLLKRSQLSKVTLLIKLNILNLKQLKQRFQLKQNLPLMLLKTNLKHALTPKPKLSRPKINLPKLPDGPTTPRLLLINGLEVTLPQLKLRLMPILSMLLTIQMLKMQIPLTKQPLL
tara:strand:- start:1783 stop:2268 length:486 start_codon:yes stop_codon:yes gene_type:complete